MARRPPRSRTALRKPPADWPVAADWLVAEGVRIHAIQQPDGFWLVYLDHPIHPNTRKMLEDRYGDSIHIMKGTLAEAVAACLAEQPPDEFKISILRRLCGEEKWTEAVMMNEQIKRQAGVA